MQESNWTPRSRTTRLYQWLLILLLFWLAAGVRAASIYKCVDAQGDVAYQAQPCASQQRETTVEIAPAPAYAASPRYAGASPVSTTTTHPARVASKERTISPRAQPMSYECHASDGQVFYRHLPCPRSLSTDGSASHGKSKGHSGGGSVTVVSRRVTREQACERIHAAGAIGRNGHEYDEDVSTYDRNLGRDPCR